MDFSSKIVSILEVLARFEAQEKQPFKARAYRNAAKKIANIRVYSVNDVRKMPGIGPSITEKISEIINTGTLSDIPIFEYTELLAVHGIGPDKARQLHEKHGVINIDDLRRNTHLLSDVQKKGVKYYDDLLHKIPRDEMAKHENFLKNLVTHIDARLSIDIVGSYRRGYSSSGDVDVLISHENDENILPQIIYTLTDANYVVDSFSRGTNKFMGVCRLSTDHIYRRIDILFASRREYPFASLYFTGDFSLNIAMRKIASKKGYVLSDVGLLNVRTGKYVGNVDSEEKIFEFLGCKYVLPTMRNDATLKAI